MRNLCVCLIGVLCLFLTSCGGGSNSKDLLIGTWKGKNKGSTVESLMEFTKDGKVKNEAIGVDSVSHGTYQWIDNDNIEISLTMPAGKTITEKSKVAVTKQALTLTNPQGSVGSYTREK
jgi:hypothetical protein